jgi:hypothetical protein
VDGLLLIRPWDVNLEPWDGTGAVSQDDINDLAILLGYADPYAAVAGFVFGLANEYYAPPDPFGDAWIFSEGAWQEDLVVELPTQWQTINPSFGKMGWIHMPLEANTRISVALTDNDDGWTDDDPIGTVELGYDDLVEAVKAGQIYEVAVHDQGQGEILFVGISVVGED